MLLKLILSATLLTSILSIATVTRADSGASALGPLDDGTLSVSGNIDPLAVTEQSINDNLASAQAPGEDVLDFSDLPLVKEFVNEEGQFGLPLDLPISVGIVDSFGDYAVGVGTAF